jgi:hypothetical protein
VVAEVPQQRPKKQEDVDGRILIARNVHWKLPAHLQHAIESPIAAQRLSAVQELGYLHRAGNEVVRTAVDGCLATLASDDSRSVSSAATALIDGLAAPVRTAEQQPIPLQRQAAPVAQPAPDPVPAAPAPRPDPAVLPASSDPPSPPPTPAPAADTPGREERVPRGTAAPPLAAVLALVVIGGALLALSRFAVFDSINGATAADLGLVGAAWILGVAVPLLSALQLFIVGRSTPWAAPLAIGLVAGAVLTQIDQTLFSMAFIFSSETSQAPGPGWWLSIAGSAVLIGCLVLVRKAVLGGHTGIRRDWRAVVAVVMVLAALVSWLQAYSGFYVWFAGVESGLLLAAVCVPFSGLLLTAGQRVAGLAAVTVLGAWLVTLGAHEFAVQTFLHDERATGVALVSTLASVAACYLAQLRPPQRRPAHPSADPAVRR